MAVMRQVGIRRQSGVALVLVLWMMVLLTVIANSLVFSSRTDVLAAANLSSAAQAEAFADAGVYMAIHQLSRARTNPPGQVDAAVWNPDGLARPWRFRETEFSVSIIDESGKIDINAADPRLLNGLFVSAGVDQAAADSLVDAILDWRDADELRQPHGAEQGDYAAAGRDYAPANADFVTIDELRQVLGMTDAVFARIESIVTVHSRQAGIDSATAPRAALMALPGVSPGQVDQFVAQRQTLIEQGLPAPPFPPAQGFAAQARTSTFSIQVEVVLSDNANFFRQAVVRLTNNALDPVQILSWRAPPANKFPVSDSRAVAPNDQSH